MSKGAGTGLGTGWPNAIKLGSGNVFMGAGLCGSTWAEEAGGGMMS